MSIRRDSQRSIRARKTLAATLADHVVRTSNLSSEGSRATWVAAPRGSEQAAVPFRCCRRNHARPQANSGDPQVTQQL
jgi:hypothetical protein